MLIESASPANEIRNPKKENTIERVQNLGQSTIRIRRKELREAGPGQEEGIRKLIEDHQEGNKTSTPKKDPEYRLRNHAEATTTDRGADQKREIPQRREEISLSKSRKAKKKRITP